MRSRVWILVIGLPLVMTACGGESGTTTSSTSAATTTTTALEGLAVAPSSWECLYLPGFVALQPPDGMDVDDAEVAAAAALNGLGGPTSAPAGATQILDDEDPPPDLPNIVTRIDDVLGLLSTDLDPLQAALTLQNSPTNIVASPIHAVAPAGHWLYKPGTDPIPMEGSLPVVGDGANSYVAVVDSGFVPDNPELSWVAGENVFYETFDIDKEPGAASHGTFIAGLIRQVAPGQRVSMARVPFYPADRFKRRNHALPNVNLTSEMHVAEAVVRLIIRHEDAGNVVALNLSLGTYACDPTKDALLVTLIAALGLWDTTIGAQTFAAGGNELGTTSFWPAALPNVRGVAAANQAGVETVWDDQSGMHPADPRYWIDDVAPGVNLVGLAGLAPTDENQYEAVCWSGSSFATAVASAQYALNITPAVKNYSGVPGLTFVADDGEVVTVEGDSPGVQGGCGLD